jgi:hypothetical protein
VSTIVVIVVGALNVDNDLSRLGARGGLSIASFALHHALAVEQKLGDVSQRGGVASSDAAMDELLQQVS